MKKLLLFIVLAAVVAVGAVWFIRQPPRPSPAAAANGRKILYYQSSMHPWIKSDQPGKCPICGMNLVPIYEGESGVDTNQAPGTVKLNADSVSVLNVQTAEAAKRPVKRTLHFAGGIVGNSWTTAWFEFTVYQNDLVWLKSGQTFDVVVPGADKRFTAQLRPRGAKSFADADFDPMTASVKLRAELAETPVEVGEFSRHKLFNGLYAESHLIAETEPVMAVPRSAVISRGNGALVYVDHGNGHYQMRAVLLGRVGDELCEVRAGLEAGEKVVTSGNLLIDSEAQLSGGR